MADVFSISDRSSIMRKVKSKENKTTEQQLISLFRKKNIKGWRRNYPVKGKPDFVFLNQKIVVFADGCFWHGHHCRNIIPKNNADYWQKKLERNIQRDIQVTKQFTNRGWTVLRFWECNIKQGNVDLTPLTGR
jgi:DNA mismatch endonuclease (patch repair protein)